MRPIARSEWLVALGAATVLFACSQADSPAIATAVAPEADLVEHPVTREEANARIARIDSELASLEADRAWAGHYKTGCGYGMLYLSLAPSTGFVFSASGCTRDDFYAGSVREIEGRLELRLESESVESECFQPESESVLVPVTRGKRRYLVAPGALDEFVQHRTPAFTRPNLMIDVLERSEDAKRRKDGAIELPAAYRAVLLETPIEAHITRVFESPVKWSNNGYGSAHRTEIDVGRGNGAFVGLQLFAGTKDCGDWLTISKVDEKTSQAELWSRSPSASTPQVGWACTSRP